MNMVKVNNDKTHARDAEATQARILQAAKEEFAANGLGGARVDVIAERAEANKRMIYHYFGSKDELFKRVLEEAYADIRQAEGKLELEHLPPKEALEKLVRFTWNYYLANPEFLTLVNSENLHLARHLAESDSIRLINKEYLSMVESILKRGVAAGDFREGIDARQLNITIAAVSYYYLTNRHTLSLILDMDFLDPDNLEKRINFNIETIMRLVAA